MTEAQVQARREQILDATMAVFEADGLEAVSFRRVAAHLGCSYSAPYRYFASKDELLTALRARAFRWMEQAMLEALAGVTGFRARLAVLSRAFIDAALSHPQRYALMFFELPDSDLAQRSLELVAAKRDSLDVCTQVIAEGEAAGEVVLDCDPLTASHLLWAGAHGIVSLQIAGQFVMGRSAEALVPTMIQALMRGIERDADSEARPEREVGA